MARRRAAARAAWRLAGYCLGSEVHVVPCCRLCCQTHHPQHATGPQDAAAARAGSIQKPRALPAAQGRPCPCCCRALAACRRRPLGSSCLAWPWAACFSCCTAASSWACPPAMHPHQASKPSSLLQAGSTFAADMFNAAGGPYAMSRRDADAYAAPYESDPAASEAIFKIMDKVGRCSYCRRCGDGSAGDLPARAGWQPARHVAACPGS